ncbi:hypothetical protein CHUAL_010552 [Chamberlinius hualienensis]
MADKNIPPSGFGSGGVGKGTPASRMQSDLGNVSSGTNFANLQRAGANSGQPAGNSTERAGFTPGGVAANSPAARVQSDLGNVQKGSEFSKMQK